MAVDDPRFLIVAMDGLRPDMISEEVCPTVVRFMAEGCVWPNARTVFPSETRVVTPTVATGAWPGRHGQIANSFTAPGGGPLVNTAPVDGLLAAVEHFGDALVAAPSLGDRLAAANKRYTVVSSGTAGNAYCLNPRARGRDQATFSVQGPKISTPAADHAGIEARLGPVPEQAVPNNERCRYATRVALEEMLPKHDPHVAVIWYSEPDIAMHYAGIGSDACRAALACVDAEFAQLLAALDARPDRERWNVILLSDHGQVTIGEKIDVIAEMRAAGFRAGTQLDADTDYAVVSSSCGNVQSRDGRIARLADWMREQPWTGLLFARGLNEVEGHVAGSFSQGLVGLDHERTPHLVYTLGQDDAENRWGFAGGALAGTGDSPPAAYGGIHGGLHRKELSCLLAARGPHFPAAAEAAAAVGPIDIAPTVLSAFAIAPAETVAGGPLVRPGLPERRAFETGAAGYSARIEMLEIEGRRYLDSGRRAS